MIAWPAQLQSLDLSSTQSFVAAGNQPGDQTGGQGDDFGKASPVALLVLILLGIGVAFLGRSMVKHVKKLPESFPGYEEAIQEAEDKKAAEKAAQEEPHDVKN